MFCAARSAESDSIARARMPVVLDLIMVLAFGAVGRKLVAYVHLHGLPGGASSPDHQASLVPS